MSRPLAELRLRASSLTQLSQELREQCVEIAREKSPSAAFNLGSRAAFVAGLSQIEALGVAKATRWLAMIRRDYGREAFGETAASLD